MNLYLNPGLPLATKSAAPELRTPLLFTRFRASSLEFPTVSTSRSAPVEAPVPRPNHCPSPAAPALTASSVFSTLPPAQADSRTGSRPAAQRESRPHTRVSGSGRTARTTIGTDPRDTRGLEGRVWSGKGAHVRRGGCGAASVRDSGSRSPEQDLLPWRPSYTAPHELDSSSSRSASCHLGHLSEVPRTSPSTRHHVKHGARGGEHSRRHRDPRDVKIRWRQADKMQTGK